MFVSCVYSLMGYKIKLVKILQELAESKPKASKGKMDKKIQTNNKITGDKPSKQLFPKQVATFILAKCFESLQTKRARI